MAFFKEVVLLLFVHLSAASSSSEATCKPADGASAAQGNRLVQLSRDVRRSAVATNLVSMPADNLGAAGCKCVGIDWSTGSMDLDLGGKSVTYPRSMGSSCEPWDYARHPDCQGSRSPSWCRRSWCFVDSCSCNLTTVPKATTYLPSATIRGRKLYYSYATCGDKDEWTSTHHKHSCVNVKTRSECNALTACAWTSIGCLGKELVNTSEVCDSSATNATVFGDQDCPCIGFDTPKGNMQVEIKGGAFKYPADFGSSCVAWDDFHHPDCHSAYHKPAWCKQRWCYVDPCRCSLAVPPKKLTYMPGSTFQGKPLFYSYGTCGENDKFTGSENKGACPNFGDKSTCEGHLGCFWTGAECKVKELADLCGTAPSAGAAPLPITSNPAASKDLPASVKVPPTSQGTDPPPVPRTPTPPVTPQPQVPPRMPLPSQGKDLPPVAPHMPPDSMPPDSLPPGSMPPDSLPPDSMPPDSLPPSQPSQGKDLPTVAPHMPPDSMPPDGLPPPQPSQGKDLPPVAPHIPTPPVPGAPITDLPPVLRPPAQPSPGIVTGAPVDPASTAKVPKWPLKGPGRAPPGGAAPPGSGAPGLRRAPLALAAVGLAGLAAF